MDLKGRLIRKETIQVHRSELDLSHLEKGIYFIQIVGERLSEKIFIY
jgi:hypothetical protein